MVIRLVTVAAVVLQSLAIVNITFLGFGASYEARRGHLGVALLAIVVAVAWVVLSLATESRRQRAVRSFNQKHEGWMRTAPALNGCGCRDCKAWLLMRDSIFDLSQYKAAIGLVPPEGSTVVLERGAGMTVEQLEDIRLDAIRNAVIRLNEDSARRGL